MPIKLMDDRASEEDGAGGSSADGAGSISEAYRDEIHFGPFRLNPNSGQLFKGDTPISLGHRAAEILTLLIRRAGETITHDEIIRHAWPTTIVEDNNLRVQISAIRKALNEEKQAYIQNIPGRGYRFTLGTIGPDHRMPDAAGHASLPATGFIGRENDVIALTAMLIGNRCVTIVGSGGIGKTRLAERVSSDAAAQIRGGVTFLDLARPLAGGSVATALMAVMRIPSRHEHPIGDLCDYFRFRECLLVMDNCEHVIDQATSFLTTLLAHSSRLTVLSTSREPLRITGERVYRLSHLPCPPLSNPAISLEEVLCFPAAQLLIDRMRANGGAARLSAKDAFPVAQLCHRLDGIPLALELAAGRVRSFGLPGLIRHLDQCPGLLTGGRRTGSSRQRAMESTLDWSFRLLSPAEETVLMRVSIFRGAFSQETALRVVGGGGLTSEDVASALMGLVHKSCMIVEPMGTMNAFRLLKTTRAYATEKFNADPCSVVTKRQYAQTIFDLIAELVPQGLSDEAEHHDIYTSLIDEVRQALDWTLLDEETQSMAAELLVKSRYIWFHLSQFDAFIDYAERVVSMLSDARANNATSMLLVLMGPAIYNAHGPVPRMRDVLEKGLDEAITTADPKAMHFGLRGLWNYHHGLAEYAQSMHIAKQYRKSARHAEGAATALATVATMTGINYLQKGKLRRAFKYLEFSSIRSNPHFSQTADPYDYHQKIVETAMLARISWLRGNFPVAFSLLDECLDAANTTQSPTSMVFALAVAVCPILLWSGRVGDVAPHVATLEGLARTHSLQHWLHYGELYRMSVQHLLYGEQARKHSDVTMSAWSPRHVEEFSVLPNGVIPLSFLTRAKSSNPIWCSAENLRSVAMRDYQAGGDSTIPQTVATLRKAIALAQSQGARVWELRATLSLAPILQRQRKCAEARSMVSRLIDHFDADDVTDDLVQAHTILPTLFVNS